jgi:hypothetical protein
MKLAGRIGLFLLDRLLRVGNVNLTFDVLGFEDGDNQARALGLAQQRGRAFV